MNEFEQMLNSVEDVKVRDVVKGEILTVEEDQATVSIVGTGVEGVLTLREITNEKDADINAFVKIGDILDLMVIKQIVGKESEGANIYLLSLKRMNVRKAWTEIEGSEGDVVTVKVLKAVKGGLSVEYKGARGFIPVSMIDTHFVRDTKRFEGQEVDAKIIEINVAEQRFILNRREVIEAENLEIRKEVFEALNVGDILEGKVARTTQFGAFIDLGGVDGLVHITELAHGRLQKPSEVVSVGDVVNVKILSLDAESGRIGLSLKAAQPGPWDDIDSKVQKGDVIEGTIKRITDFGAFVEIFPSIEGLVHVSQISWERVENPKEVLKTGDTVKVKVLDVKSNEERISLSIKALEEAPARPERKSSDNNGNSSRDGQRRERKPRDKRNSRPSMDFNSEPAETITLADQFADLNWEELLK